MVGTILLPMPGKRNQRTILSWSWFHLAKGQLLWPVFRTCGIRISSGTAEKKHKETRYWFPVYLYRESPYHLEYKPFFSTANWSQSLHLGILKNLLSNQSMFFPCVSLFFCVPKYLSLQGASCSSSKSFCPLDTSWYQDRFAERRCFKGFASSLPWGWPQTNTEKCGKTQLTSNMFHQFHAKQKPSPNKLEEFPA